MLSEIQGALRPQITQQQRTVSSESVLASGAPATSSNLDIALVPPVEVFAPKVQVHKPVEIKVDIEKMRVNLQESLDKFNAKLRDGGRNLTFNIDAKSGGMVILVKNADTGEVVRQIPNDVVVRIAHDIDAFKGLLHNELT